MIDKQEILSTAQRMSLLPNVVEKDYVLGWMLAGIYAHPELKEVWVFKGGTCLKKCYFETYRFSEDLDFTLTEAAHLDAGFLARVFAEIGAWIYERAGIEVPADKQAFDIYPNTRGSLSCEGRISYCGPVSPRSGGLPRIKLDLLADERLVLPPVEVAVFHPYSDAPVEGFSARAYAYEEVFAEKVRALGERTRPRDLYDVINLFRNADARPAPSVMLDVLKQKCAHKNIQPPKLSDLEPHRESLSGSWADMLKHQLPSLPPLESFWGALPEFFEWLASGRAPIAPAAYGGGAGEVVLRERDLRLPISAARQAHVEVIRFAAANRLCVELEYRKEDGRRTKRVVEPYSLRRTSKGDIVLHVHDRDRNAHRSYRLDRIDDARVTSDTFVPLHQVELTPTGAVLVAPPTRRVSPPASSFRAVRAAPVRRTGSGAPTYIFQCPQCHKQFRRSKMDSKLNAHKNDRGGQCSGRTGYYVDTR